MIRTGNEYRESLRDGREIWISGERVVDVTEHPAFKPAVDIRARVYDMAHEGETQDIMSYIDPVTGERNATGQKLPRSREDWRAKRRAVDTVMDDVAGIVTRVGDETIGELWSLYDGQTLLESLDPACAENVRLHVERSIREDRFHVSANTDPKGDRSRTPQEQDPDMLLRVVRETDRGIVVRGAKYETAAAYANQAFVKPTIPNWGDAELSEYAVGFIVDMGAPGLKHLCRAGFAQKNSRDDAPLASRFDEVDTLVIFDDVEIPWGNVLFYQHTKAAVYMRSTIHRYSAFPFVQRTLRIADLLIGAALFNIRQTGLERHQSVREKLAALASYREGIDAHLLAAIDQAEASPEGLVMPNQSFLYAGRVFASSQLPEMMHIARELCGGQIGVTPDAASFEHPETGPWLSKYYSIGDEWPAEERRKLLTFARDLLNSDYAGHRLTFQLFAQAPPFANLAALYHSYDWDRSAEMVRHAAGLADGAGEQPDVPPLD